jgi:hypothetical protein
MWAKFLFLWWRRRKSRNSVINMNFVFPVKVRSNSISQARGQKQLILIKENRMCREHSEG